MPLLVAIIAGLTLTSHPIAPRSIQNDSEVKNIPPRQPWIFRSVLDGRARIVTLALAKDFWLAYDATNCGLYKFWKGDVNFEGSVYNSVHGPQPSSQGGSIEDGILDRSVWVLRSSSQGAVLKPNYRGFKVDPKNRSVATLQYDLNLEGRTVQIEETPTLIWEKGKTIGLRRTFRRLGELSQGDSLSVIVQKSGGGVKKIRLMVGQ
jgi:hypothetical protein